MVRKFFYAMALCVWILPGVSFAQYNDLNAKSRELQDEIRRMHREVAGKVSDNAVQRAIKGNEKDLERLRKAQKSDPLHCVNQTGPFIPPRYHLLVDSISIGIFIILICLLFYKKNFRKKHTDNQYHFYE